MKRLLIIPTIILAVVALIAISSPARAIFIGGDNHPSRVGSDQTIDDDLYISGKDVVVNGTVNGDVYAAGQSVTIRGTVNGDVLAAGQDVEVGGIVKGSVRAAGNTVRLSGAQIGGGVSDASQSFTLENDSSVGGGLNFFSANANLRGNVSRSVAGGASNAVMSGEYGKDVSLSAKAITLESGSKVNGTLTYYGDSQLHRDSGSQVIGGIHHANLPAKKQEAAHRGFSVLATLWALVSLYAVGALLLWLLPGVVAGVAAAIERRPWAALGLGFVWVLLLIPAFIVLAITIIGIPLAVLWLLFFLLCAYLAEFLVGLALGRQIARRADWTQNPYADAAIGVLILTLIGLIPIIGWLAKLAIVVLGLGGIILLRAKPAKA